MSETYPVVTADPGVTRQVLSERAELMVVAFTFEKGAEGALHRHPHVQSTYVRAGEFLFTVDGVEMKLVPGDSLIVPSNAEHGCRCLEAGTLIDTFTPPPRRFPLRGPEMLNVDTRYAIHAEHAKGMDTEALRENFLAESLFIKGEVNLVYTHYDRMVLGGAVPGSDTLTLDHVAQAGTPSFLDRREMGVVNIGDTGTVSAGDETWTLNRGDVLYLGCGSGPVTFEGDGRFYLASTPAHRNFPNRLITIDEAEKLSLGSAETSNQRTINQFIHPLVMESCQLVLGYTALDVGSVWNTMPAHTHDRRMEAYLYFDLNPDARIFHLMGEPTQTRHMVLANEQAAISPPWSIHSAAGTSNYTFVWAMAGDNVDYTDMDFVQPGEMR